MLQCLVKLTGHILISLMCWSLSLDAVPAFTCNICFFYFCISVPKCPEPFQTLGMLYEMQGDMAKALQVRTTIRHPIIIISTNDNQKTAANNLWYSSSTLALISEVLGTSWYILGTSLDSESHASRVCWVPLLIDQGFILGSLVLSL